MGARFLTEREVTNIEKEKQSVRRELEVISVNSWIFIDMDKDTEIPICRGVYTCVCMCIL